MKNNIFAIIEIGSSNTKVKVFENDKILFEESTTIEFKKNYKLNKKIITNDLEKLYTIIEKTLEYTNNINIYGCSIFRTIKDDELTTINEVLLKKYNLKITVVSQEEEAEYTALGCYKDLPYQERICIFVGGGGSTELIFVKNGKIEKKLFFEFGAVDITNKFETLKEDKPTCTFKEVYDYIDGILDTQNEEAPLLILAGGDFPFWYISAKYEMKSNDLYKRDNQPYLLTKEMCNEYDLDSFKKSLNVIKENSNNPLWFDGARSMRVIANVVMNKIKAKNIIPTKINMIDGIKSNLIDFYR